MKNIFKTALLIITLLTGIIGCGKSEDKPKEQSKKVIKLGISGEENIIWESVKTRLAAEGIELKLISFSDYVRPNLALQEKELDANSFQTVIYFDKFKADHKLTIVNAAYTILTPMGIYSKKLTNLSTLKDKAKVAIPNDASNGARGLLLLQDAGLIKLTPRTDGLETVKDIIENPKQLEIIELVATQIPRSLEDIDIAAINNNVAIESGYNPSKDSIFLEDPKQDRMKKYFNIIAVREDNQNNAEIKKLLEIYNTQETRNKIVEYYKGSGVPAF
ncbi:MAG: MetQ/NlpA family ABC transporter substrate-binding protein [Fusobacteriaceae bacterium]